MYTLVYTISGEKRRQTSKSLAELRAMVKQMEIINTAKVLWSVWNCGGVWLDGNHGEERP